MCKPSSSPTKNRLPTKSSLGSGALIGLQGGGAGSGTSAQRTGATGLVTPECRRCPSKSIPGSSRVQELRPAAWLSTSVNHSVNAYAPFWITQGSPELFYEARFAQHL